jgi:hypothetical protein
VTEAWWDSSVEAQVISRCHKQTAVGAVKAVIMRGTNSLIDVNIPQATVWAGRLGYLVSYLNPSSVDSLALGFWQWRIYLIPPSCSRRYLLEPR